MSETARYMLVRGIAAAKAEDTDEAQHYLERVFHNNPTPDQTINAHLWLSRITTDQDRQREHLEEVLAIEPTRGEAQRALAILDGRLKPQDVIDPDDLPQGKTDDETEAPLSTQAQRYICPMCAGQMEFQPGSTWALCEYCGHRQPLLTVLQNKRALEERNFVVTLATEKAHVAPEATRIFRCQGCQATLLASGEITVRCPYCGSAHLLQDEPAKAILPEGIIPFVISETETTIAFRQWLDLTLRDRITHTRTTRPRGIYLPIWTFDVMGEVGWRSTKDGNTGLALGLANSLVKRRRRLNRRANELWDSSRHVPEGTHYTMMDDIVVPATHRVPFNVIDIFNTFDLERAVPYNSAILCNWPADLYQVMVSDASLIARKHALDRAHQEVETLVAARAGARQSLQVFSRTLSVQAYKLLLVPIWLMNYQHQEITYTVVVNGQTGQVCGESPTRGLRRLLQRTPKN